ncbi:MAG: hypothetical protein ACM3Q2_04855 [Syntrophothermus sp.]
MKLKGNGRWNMELDDFKKNEWHSTSPESGPASRQGPEIGQFTGAFKAHMNKQRKKVLYTIILLSALSIIYISRLVKETNWMSIGYGLIIIGFILGAVYLYFANKPLPERIYSLPMSDFLNKAEKKLVFMSLRDWLIVIPLLLTIGTGGGIIFVVSLLKYTSGLTMLIFIWISFFVILITFAFYVSKKDWKKEHGEMLTKIRSLKNQ